MITYWETDSTLGPGITAQPEEYDAIPPLKTLQVGALPRQLSPDREAISIYLAFGHWTSGHLKFPRSLSPETAEAIEADSMPARIRTDLIEYAAREVPTGNRQTLLGFTAGETMQHSPTLSVIDNINSREFIQKTSSLTVSSNAFAFDRMDSQEHFSIRARLAVAVLFAEDADVESLVLNTVKPANDELSRLRALLAVTNIGLDAT